MATNPLYIVGVGASAGGLEALEHLFEQMPADTGMAFVVVQHLSPDFKSMMDELLARKTSIPIHRVEDSMVVAADQIYLIPPKKDMVIAEGKLLLTDKDPKQGVSLPIDNFFRSLAQDVGDRAIGIVLSGTGSDGSRGIREIHGAGGLVIAQSPESAKFDGMPNSAKQTGAVDLVLPPQEMPAALVRFAQHGLWQGPVNDGNVEAGSDQMPGVFRMLREACGIDFSHYKVNTVTRRIDRRILLQHLGGLEDYVLFLRENPAEIQALYKDLLIGVTRFFRDAEAFVRLERDVLPELIAAKADGDDLRIWVAACATGEEAYSVAMSVREVVEAAQRRLNVKVFATDVHRASVETAGAGVYGEAQLTEVSPDRLAKYFVAKNGRFQVTNDLRQMVVFAQHNLLKDAPFTKLDLVTCRNLLIYLQPPIQKKVLSFFHFALNMHGVLFLGPSESPGEIAEEFATLDAHWKMYRKRRDSRIAADYRLPMVVDAAAPRLIESTPRVQGQGSELLEVFGAVLDHVAPPSLLVDERGQLLHTTGDAHHYLQLKKGPVSVDILDLIDPELKVLVGAGLVRARQENTPIAYRGLRIQRAQEDLAVDLTIRPLIHPRTKVYHAWITFTVQGPAPLDRVVSADADAGRASRERLTNVEDELRHTKENLQATIEELETSNEELQAANEELVASNEELQSTNEELHSVNEELYSVNAEFQKKITELTEMTEDMDNLLEGNRVFTLFLDMDLCIRKFTPRMGEVFNLLPQDVGRRLDNFAHNIDSPNLMAEIAQVAQTEAPCEHHVCDSRRNWYLMRILPYRTKMAFAGIALTLVDVTSLKVAEDNMRRQEMHLSTILANSPHLVSIKDSTGRYLLTDAAFAKVAGQDPIGKTNSDLFPPEVADDLNQLDHRVLNDGSTVETEVVIPRADGPHTYLTVKFPLRDDQQRIVGVSSIKTDVTRLKRAEVRSREAVEQRDRFLAVLSHELRNPLGAMVNAAALLEMPGAEEGVRSEAVSVLQRQAEQMSRLLDDLLEVSRITQEKFHLAKEVVGLPEIAEEAVRVAKPALDKAQVAFSCHLDSALPRFVGDEVRLQQMIVNLLINSAKFTAPGGQVRLDLAQEEQSAVIRVKDNGQGIRPDVLPKIFNLFVQAENSLDRSNGGLGVGLSLVRAIAELHGGSVHAASAGPGQGAEFTVRLPLSGGPDAESVAPPALEKLMQGAHGVVPAKVVIVEDNDDSRRMLAALLHMEVDQVWAAADGLQGVEAITIHRPDVAIVDIGLPILSGYEVAREVRKKLGQAVYLVALTGYGQENDREAVLEAGFDEHLVKPLRRTDLSRVIQRLHAKPTK